MKTWYQGWVKLRRLWQLLKKHYPQQVVSMKQSTVRMNETREAWKVIQYSFPFFSTVRCHLLNVDVVTMFSPEMLDILNITKEQCEDCIKAMKTLSAEDYWPKNIYIYIYLMRGLMRTLKIPTMRLEEATE